MRLDGDVEFLRSSPSNRQCRLYANSHDDLEQPERIITALQQFSERRLVLSSYVLVDRFKRLDGSRESARLDDADECAVEAHASLEERGVRSYSLASLERGGRIHRVESIERECHDRAFCNKQ
jgi:hypothetical protein